MFQNPAVVDVQIILIFKFERLRPLDRPEPSLAFRQREFLFEQQRCIRTVFSDRPLQAVISFEPVIAYSCKKWCQGSCFIQDLTRMRSEEHTSELQSRGHLVCSPLLEKIED